MVSACSPPCMLTVSKQTFYDGLISPSALFVRLHRNTHHHFFILSNPGCCLFRSSPHRKVTYLLKGCLHILIISNEGSMWLSSLELLLLFLYTFNQLHLIRQLLFYHTQRRQHNGKNRLLTCKHGSSSGFSMNTHWWVCLLYTSPSPRD